MKSLIILCSIALCSVATANLVPMSHQQALEKLASLPPSISTVIQKTPRIYNFKNSDGEPTAGYIGQTFRQILIHDLKPIFLKLKRASYQGDEKEAFKILNSIYEYKADAIRTNDDMINGETEMKVRAKAEGGLGFLLAEGDFYFGVYEKGTHLKKKIAGVDNPLRRGELKGWKLMSYAGVQFDTNQDGLLTPDELVNGLMKVQAKNMASTSKTFKAENKGHSPQEVRKASITQNGWELANLTQKILHSAVSFSQAAGDYLSIDLAHGKGLKGDNDHRVIGSDGITRSFTYLQKHWDEAYGYFGAARNYLDYSDKQLKEKASLDSFLWDEDTNIHEYVEAPHKGDNLISVQSEMNFAFAVNAGKRDLGAIDNQQKTDFNLTVARAFLRGRQLIQEKPQGYLEFAQAYSVVALTEWEKIIAASVIHYINATLNDLNKYASEEYQFVNLAKHFSEMKGFALAFQFNPNSLLSHNDFDRFHILIGDFPVLPQHAGVEGYKEKLLHARDIIQRAYGFTNLNAEKW